MVRKRSGKESRVEVATYFMGFKSFGSLSGALVSQDEEGSSVLVEC